MRSPDERVEHTDSCVSQRGLKLAQRRHKNNMPPRRPHLLECLRGVADPFARKLLLLHLMEKIEAAGAGFRSLTEAIDTTTPAGRMMMQMVGSFAEFERAMIRERTSAGLAQARLEGRLGGRRRKLDDKKRREIAESVVAGRKSGAEMARLYDVSEPTVSRIVAEYRQREAHEALA